jgi:hypothetical protein
VSTPAKTLKISEASPHFCVFCFISASYYIWKKSDIPINQAHCIYFVVIHGTFFNLDHPHAAVYRELPCP